MCKQARSIGRVSSILCFLALSLVACTSNVPQASTSTPTATTSTATALITWPFHAGKDQWAIVNGYRGYADHAQGYAMFALDLAICLPGKVQHLEGSNGTCDLSSGWANTVGAPVYSPVNGTVAWTQGRCYGLSIAVDGQPGLRVVLWHIDLLPGESWSQLASAHTHLSQGEEIGTVSTGHCQPGTVGNHIHMGIYSCTDCLNDPDTARVGHAFDGVWSIGNCSYPDDGVTSNEYRGFLVPCTGSVIGTSTSTVSPPTQPPSPVPGATPKPAPTATPKPAPTATPKPAPTATPTAAPTATPSGCTLSNSTWQGQGTYNSGQSPFDMLLTINVDGNTFTGTLTEDTYNSEVAVTGTIDCTSDSLTITFTDPSTISGGAIALNTTYVATVANGAMNGVWYYAGDSSPDGNLTLQNIG